MNRPLVSPEVMAIVPVGAWFAVTVSVAALLSHRLRPGVRVHGRHPQTMPGRPLPGRGVAHQQVADERVHPALL